MHPPPWLKFVWRKGFAKGGLSGFILAAHLYLLKIVPLSGHETSPAPFRFTIPPVLPRSNRIFRLFHSTTHPSCQDYSTNGRLFFSIRRIFNRINSFQRLVRFLQTRGDRQDLSPTSGGISWEGRGRGKHKRRCVGTFVIPAIVKYRSRSSPSRFCSWRGHWLSSPAIRKRASRGVCCFK